MTHLVALRHSESRAALVLLHQHLGIAEITADRRALAALTSRCIRVVLSRLRGQVQRRIRLVLGVALRRRGRGGVDLHLRFHAGRPILRPRRQTVPMLPEVLLRVAQERTEHIGDVPDAHRAHGIRATLCRCERKIFIAR